LRHDWLRNQIRETRNETDSNERAQYLLHLCPKMEYDNQLVERPLQDAFGGAPVSTDGAFVAAGRRESSHDVDLEVQMVLRTDAVDGS
jgi:hypothetical protein